MKGSSILFLAPSLSIGGAERVLVNLLKKLDLNKYDVTLCLLSNTGVYFSELPEGVKVIYIFKSSFVARSLTFIQRKFHNVSIIKYFVRHRITWQYKLGICFSDGLLTDDLLMAKDRFCKTLSWVHSCYYSQKSLRDMYTPDKVRKLKKSRYDLLSGLVFVSNNSMREFNQIFGQYPKEFCVYNLFDFNGMDKKAGLFIPEGFDDKTVNFIAIGRLVKVKEYDRLIEASRILKSKGLNFKIRIIGDGPQKKVLADLIEKYSLDDTVYLLGFKNNPYPYLKDSDVLVLTSSSEAMPTVLVEDMHFSKPVIATKCPGCIEITDNGKYGLLTEHDVSDITLKMEKMIVDIHVRDYYSSMSAERCRHFNENVTLSRIEEIFDTI